MVPKHTDVGTYAAEDLQSVEAKLVLYALMSSERRQF